MVNLCSSLLLTCSVMSQIAGRFSDWSRYRWEVLEERTVMTVEQAMT